MSVRRPSGREAVPGLYDEIVRRLEAAAAKPARKDHSRFHREELAAYGLAQPQLERLVRGWRATLEELGLRERLALARLLLASHVEEQGHVAIAALRAGIDQLTPAVFDEIDRLLDHFSSWSITDDFATGRAGVTPRLLERYPRETLRLLRRWSKSASRWKRRASAVTFTRHIAARGAFTDEGLRLCAAMQRDEDDLVQKGVGWALKDTMRAGPDARLRVIDLVAEMRRNGVPSTVTLYAIRDLRGAEREAVLRIKPRR